MSIGALHGFNPCNATHVKEQGMLLGIATWLLLLAITLKISQKAFKDSAELQGPP